jgi:HlyD family secretion protein
MPPSRPFLALGLVGVLLLLSCTPAPGVQTGNTVRTEEVRRGTLQVTVPATGSVVFPRQAKLSFGSAGTVREMRVRVGQVVQEGEVLARLDTRDLEKALLRARQELRSAEKALQDYLDSFSEVRLAQARAAVETARANLAGAEEAYAAAQEEARLLLAQAEQRVAEARLGVKRAREALQKAKTPYSEEEIARAREAVDLARSGLETARRSLQSAEMALDITRREWAKRLQDAQDTELLQEQARRALLEAENAVRRAADGVTTAQWSLADAEKRLAAMLAPPDPLDIEVKEKALVVAQAALERAEAEVARLQGGGRAMLLQRAAQVASARAALVAAQEEMDRLLQGPDPLVVEVRRLSVEAAKANLADIELRLAEATLRAPFRGVVAHVQAEEGVAIGATTPAVALLDPSRVEATVGVDETDIARIRLGQEALVAIEPLGPTPLRGRVIGLSPVARVQQGVVSYEVTLALAPPQGGPPLAEEGFLALGLREGMTVSARILLEQKEGVLIVPPRAVRREGGKTVVEVLDANGKRVVREVRVGLTGDQGVEVVEGLSAGERVVIPSAATGRPGRDPETTVSAFGPRGIRVR